MTLISMLIIGFLLGMKHATEADHVAAVATLATRGSSLAQTARLGAAWGLGHTATLMVFGGAVLMLGLDVPERVAQLLELAVGVMLVLLGADVLRRLRRDRIHFHGHRHPEDGVAHFHAHSHRDEPLPHEVATHKHLHPRGASRRALVVGMVHGMAGSAALILLSLQTMKSAAWGVAYIAVFGLGSVLGMAALSLAIAVPLRFSAQRFAWAHSGLSAVVGLATMGLGIFVFLAALPAQAMEVNTTAGVAIKGYDPVAYFRIGVPTLGREELTARHRDATYRFTTVANRDAFVAHPDQFLPQYGGFCAFGVARGYKAEIDPHAFSLVGGKLYLNYSEQVKVDWQKDIPGHIRRADERWPEVRVTTKVIR